ncbi:MFS transporter [Salinimonas lutimaris]|uniref:MFS transporter n=1 Tax=Salinimonas lutimaris TaxID=914153 RepID=UPI0010C0AC5A|nr:MFS transporter [Salinimonas lutimaris]
MIYGLLFCALLATAIGQSVFITTVPSLGREAGLSELAVAILMSSSALVFAVGTNIWSRIIRRRGFRNTLLTGLAGYTLGTLAFALVWSAGLAGLLSSTALLIALLTTRSLQSSVMSATPPAAVGYVVATSTPETRAAAISKVTSANNLGQILGPPFAGALVGFGLLTPMYSVLGLTILAMAMVWWRLPEYQPASPQPPAAGPPADVAVLKSNTAWLIGGCAIVFVCIAMMQQSLSFFMMDVHQASPVEAARFTGFAMMISAVFSLLVQFTVVQRRWLSPPTLIWLAFVCLSIAYWMLYLHHSMSLLYTAMVFLGVGMGMGYPALAAVATTRCAPERQTQVTGLLTATPAMGYIVGPPLSAVLYAQQMNLPFALAGCLTILLAGIMYWQR